MAMTFGDNIQLNAKKPDFTRQQYELKEDMGKVRDSAMPEMYLAYCLEDRQIYLFNKENEVDPVTGKFRIFESGGGSSGVDVMPEPGPTYEGKVLQYIGPSDGNYEQGYFYICNSTHHYETLPIETVDKMKEQIALNGEEVILRNMFGEELLGDCEKGNASYVTSGEIVDKFKAMVEKMFNGAATAKGALIIEPAKVIVTTPGPDNKKVI